MFLLKKLNATNAAVWISEKRDVLVLAFQF